MRIKRMRANSSLLRVSGAGFLRPYAHLSLLLGSCAIALALAGSPARAMDDGDDNLVHEFTSLLGINGDKSPDIDYRDRAPLVLPPKGKSGLVKPKAAHTTIQPDWPNDPDEMKARKAAEEARMPIINVFKPTHPEEQDKAARLASRVPNSEPTAPQVKSCNQKMCPPTPEEIAAVDKSLSGLTQTNAPNTTGLGQEPDREWLTEPPKGYRKVTQLVDDKDPATDSGSSNPFSFLTKWLPGN